jgi:malonyl-CoA/methylmalonyl-CoA synthetase
MAAETPSPLLPALRDPAAGEALRFPEGSLTYEALREAAVGVASQIGDTRRAAVWATASLDTCVAVVGALLAGAAVVPLNPKLGRRELEHVVTDSAPDVLLAPADAQLPDALAGIPRHVPSTPVAADAAPPEPGPDAPALIMYTSGTTGPPKGVVLSRRAVAANLDALAAVWEWTPEDTLVHGLPLFHAHGLVLGVLGPLRLGGRLHHVGHFSVEAVSAALDADATMLFAVPTMYHRLAEAAQDSTATAGALRRARLLVSGSAALAVRDHARIERATGQRIAERYGLTETLMNCAATARGTRRAGYVGPPLPGVELRLLDEAGATIDAADDETIGEIAVRGPNLFNEYLNRPEATAAAMRDGWFLTGDLATRTEDGSIRIVGRRATDLIKTGGFKVGAGEIEAALLAHPGVLEAAVTGEPDDDLGERIVAWVAARSRPAPGEDELIDHVARLLAPHKRPRTVRFLDELPRNAMGKLLKTQLVARPAAAPQPGSVLTLGEVEPDIAANAFVAQGAIVVGGVRIGPRSSVWYAAVLRGDEERIVIGSDSNIQDGSVLHADPGDPVIIEDRVTVGHRAIVHGAHVESDTLIGMGAIVLNGARIGTGSVIAAGAVVRPGTQIPPGSMAAGVPAVVRRPVSEAERDYIASTPDEYVAQATRHRDSARRQIQRDGRTGW